MRRGSRRRARSHRRARAAPSHQERVRAGSLAFHGIRALPRLRRNKHHRIDAEPVVKAVDGAVSALGVDAPVAWHYGDPLGEQRALLTGSGLIDRSHRDVLTVSGTDRLPWLHSICSQHVSDLADGDSTESLVLSPHGHVEQHWQVTELGATVWIDVEPGTASEVLAYLEKMRFLKRVELA